MNILIVAAHPDDEVLGCFGTIAKLIQRGYNAYTLILGEGKRARGADSELEILKEELKNANKTIGIKEVFTENFPDNAFDSVPLLEIVKKVEYYKNKVKPSIIFTHYEKDLNIDHQITYKAVITATRPMKEEVVKEIYSFEILSSTEWSYPLSFSPDTFFDISNTIELKLKAMSFYKSELREYPHPRSLKGIEINAKNWGMKVGLEYVEAFKCVRRIV
jgi:LmbE family N-acetylglucosaminyl deacetylase